LPEPIAAYFAVDKFDDEAVARCFTNNAVVKDAGRRHAELAAIMQWKAETSTSTPIPASRSGSSGATARPL
jgi:hypothetical protein